MFVVCSYARSCTLPWPALRRALKNIAWWRFGSKPGIKAFRNRLGPQPTTPDGRYRNAAPFARMVVAYPADDAAATLRINDTAPVVQATWLESRLLRPA